MQPRPRHPPEEYARRSSPPFWCWTTCAPPSTWVPSSASPTRPPNRRKRQRVPAVVQARREDARRHPRSHSGGHGNGLRRGHWLARRALWGTDNGHEQETGHHQGYRPAVGDCHQPLSRAAGGEVVGQGDIEPSQSSSSRSLSSSPRWSRSAFSVAQRMFFITFCAVM